MQRRNVLKGSAGLDAAGLSGPASAQELANPRILELIRIHWCYGRPNLRRNIYSLYNESEFARPSCGRAGSVERTRVVSRSRR